MKTKFLRISFCGLAMSVVMNSVSAANFFPSGVEAIKGSANLVVSHFLAEPDPAKGLAAANMAVVACYENFLPDAPKKYHQSFMDAGLTCMAADMSDWTLHEWVQARAKGVAADKMYGATSNDALSR